MRLIVKLKFLLARIPRKIQMLKWEAQANDIYQKTLKAKKCSFGPFLGEFGHLLGHNLPFIAHLQQNGVEVNFCGLTIHQPFFYDENCNRIVKNYVAVRDFFGEFLPDCNTSETPTDVTVIKTDFVNQAIATQNQVPYFDNSNVDYYFNFFRWWVLKKGYHHTFDLEKVYQTKKEKSVVIFPRKWNDKFTANQLKNNGGNWDYKKIATICSKLFEKVYVIGHPVFTTVDFAPFDNVEVHVTNDNSVILEKCSNASLIITQHSGSVYLGEYTNSQVLIIYKGGQKETDIGDIEITKQFKKALGEKYNFNYAFSETAIAEYCERFVAFKK